jgi:DNA modification methylase
MSQPTIIGPCELWHGDCLEILPKLSGVDAVVTDPPYGIGYQSILTDLGATKHDKITGDERAPDLRFILQRNCSVLVFGANNWPDQLPHRGRWLCWDKRTIDGACDAMLGNPIELAWANKTTGYDKIVRVLHGGVVNADGGKRLHPTQKPVQVMVQAILWAARNEITILDPYMGSGTTGIACVRTGRKFIGIEIDANYFRIACDRIQREVDQFTLPLEINTKPTVQQEMTNILPGRSGARE